MVEILKAPFRWVIKSPRRIIGTTVAIATLAGASYLALNVKSNGSVEPTPQNPVPTEPLPESSATPPTESPEAEPTSIPTETNSSSGENTLVINGNVVYPVTCYTYLGAPIRLGVRTPLWQAKCLGMDAKGKSYWLRKDGKIVATTVDP